MTLPYTLSAGELSVRTDAAGGGVLPQVAGSLGAYGSQIVFLFHGYNDSLGIARASYASFLQNFPGPGNPLHDKWQPAIHRCYWPGDKAWGPFSFASYPLEIGAAKDSAAVFADFLAALAVPGAGTFDVYFIAHSLGNRLVLELLSALENLRSSGRLSSQIQFRGFCSMAAAVPVSFAQPGGSLFGAAILSLTRRTLYSESDTVLHFAFPLGESAAGEGFFPTAIGRYGQPQSDWTAETEMWIDAQRGYNHGDYWAQPNTIPQVSAFFDIPTPAVPPSTYIAAHSLPAPLALPKNQLPTYALPSRRPFGG